MKHDYRPSLADYAAKGSPKGTLGTKYPPSRTPKLLPCWQHVCRVCLGR